jgi:hypothetical protein
MPNIAGQRLYNQRLEGPKFQRPDEVVAWLGAVQAQEYALAKWALGLRMEHATDDVIEQAFTDGLILRTHVMRPTWHFVTPVDIRWMLELTAPRVHAVNAYPYRKMELDDALLQRSSDTIASALEGGRYLTRAELSAVLADTGVDTTNGIRLGYILHFAELEGIVCNGPRRGKQHTYALLDERVPSARRLVRDEALGELTLRFFTSHGPATVKDFSWWSGLTGADVKAGLAMLTSQLGHEVIDGQTYWSSMSKPAAEEPPVKGHILPVYDEYGIAYKNRSAILDPQHAEQAQNPLFTSAFALNGEIIGMWRRTFSKKSVVIESAPFRPFSAAEGDAFAAASRHFGAFLEMPVVLLNNL